MPQPSQPEERLLDRYVVEDTLGQGSSGVVYRARDEVTGAKVAAKVLNERESSERTVREVAALELLQLPGVVRILDHGRHGGQSVIVTELVGGLPFPGTGRLRVAWSELEGPLERLLTVLSAMHGKGLIHRDLKPSNVLVDASGAVVVLDFGLARGVSLSSTMTLAGTIVGTPAYLSPEQALGRPVTPRTDLYSVGAMCFEALVGAPPHLREGESAEVADLLVARRHGPSPRIAWHDVAIPDYAARLLDGLLEREPADRIPSARAALRALRDGSGYARPRLPRLGGKRPVWRVVERLQAGLAVRVWGPSGAGRTRLLDDAAAILQTAGHAVHWLVPAREPLGSLGPSGLTAALEPHASLASVTAELVRRMQEWSTGPHRAVWFADDVEWLDPWSRELLLHAAGTTPIAYVARRGPGRVACVSALPPRALQPLFAGPDAVWHLREDGAQELWRRTGGLARRVVEELDDWERVGLCTSRDDRVWIERHVLDGLRVEAPSAAGLLEWRLGRLPPAQASAVAAPAAQDEAWGAWRATATLPAEAESGLAEAGESPEDSRPGPASEEELLGWASLLGTDATPSLLARVTGWERWKVEALGHRLEEAGKLARSPTGWVASSPWEGQLPGRAADRLERALSAWDVGHLARVQLRVMFGPSPALTQECLAAAARLLEEGRLAEAFEVALGGINAAQRAQAGAVIDGLRDTLAIAALHHAASDPKERAAAALGARYPREPRCRAVVGLLRAAVALSRRQAEPCLQQLPPAQELVHPALVAWRALTAFRATMILQGPAWAAAGVSRLEKELAHVPQDERAAALAAARGYAAYTTARYAEAAAQYAEQRQWERLPHRRLAAATNETNAHIAAMEYASALASTERALALAIELRDAPMEARCLWMSRTLRYRMARRLPVPWAELDAVTAVGDSELTASAHLTEAAIAWRASRRDEAILHARSAARVWLAMKRREPAALAYALAAAAGDSSALQESVALLLPGLSGAKATTEAQAWALLALVEPAMRANAPADLSRRLAAELTTTRRSARLEVLSLAELHVLPGMGQGSISHTT